MLCQHDFPESFDKHLLLYDDSMPELYGDDTPDGGSDFCIHVFPAVVADMLHCFFVQ